MRCPVDIVFAAATARRANESPPQLAGLLVVSCSGGDGLEGTTITPGDVQTTGPLRQRGTLLAIAAALALCAVIALVAFTPTQAPAHGVGRLSTVKEPSATGGIPANVRAELLEDALAEAATYRPDRHPYDIEPCLRAVLAFGLWAWVRGSTRAVNPRRRRSIRVSTSSRCGEDSRLANVSPHSTRRRVFAGALQSLRSRCSSRQGVCSTFTAARATPTSRSWASPSLCGAHMSPAKRRSGSRTTQACGGCCCRPPGTRASADRVTSFPTRRPFLAQGSTSAKRRCCLSAF